MEILQLDGLEPQLFNLIGPLVMNPKVLKANNNYPFKTTERFQWYIAINDDNVVGFLPVEQKGSGGVINNYYIQDDNAEVLEGLLAAASSTRDYVSAIVLIRHEPVFTRCGFQPEHRWTKYIKMIHTTQTKDEK